MPERRSWAGVARRAWSVLLAASWLYIAWREPYAAFMRGPALNGTQAWRPQECLRKPARFL